VEDPRPAFVGRGGYIGAKSEEWEGWGGGGAGSFFGWDGCGDSVKWVVIVGAGFSSWLGVVAFLGCGPASV